MACLNDMMKQLLNSETVMNAVVSTAATNTKSPLHSEFADYYSSTVRSMTRHTQSKPTVDVRRIMSPQSLQELVTMYPEYNVVSSGCESGTHSVAAACRMLETRYLLDMLPTEATFVWDVGGNWATHIKRGKTNIHCCCPILDFRDAERKQTRFTALERFARNGEPKTEEFSAAYRDVKETDKRIRKALNSDFDRVLPEDFHGRYFCQNTFQDCVWNPPEAGLRYAIAVHSIYDISPEDLATTMRRKKITQLYGCFLFSPYMLLDGNCDAGDPSKKDRGGLLPFVDGRYCIIRSRMKKTLAGLVGHDKVRFWFNDDPNLGYEHNFDQYISYVKRSYFKAADGGVCAVELMQMRGDTMFFKMTDVSEYQAHLGKNIGTRKFTLNSRDSAVPFETEGSFKCIPLPQNADCLMPVFHLGEDTDVLEVRIVRVPNVLRKRIEEYLMRLNDNKLDLQSAKSMLASINNSIVFNGTHVRVVDSVEPSLLSSIAITVVVREMYRRRDEKTIVDMLKIQGEKCVSLKNILKHVWGTKIWPRRGYIQKGLRWLARLVGHVTHADLHKVCELPMFITLEDAITAWKLDCNEATTMFDMSEEVERQKELEEDIKNITHKLVQSVGADEVPKGGGILDDILSSIDRPGTGGRKEKVSLDKIDDDAVVSVDQMDELEEMSDVARIDMNGVVHTHKILRGTSSSSSGNSGRLTSEGSRPSTSSSLDIENFENAVDLRDFLQELCPEENVSMNVEDNRVHLTLVDDSMLPEKTPSRPALTGDYDTDAKWEYLWYLRSKIACDKAGLYKLVQEYCNGYYHSERVAMPKNSYFLKCGDNGVVDYVLKKATLDVCGHEFAIEFLEGDGGAVDIRQYNLKWARDKTGKIRSSLPINLRRGYSYLISDLTKLKNEQKIFNNLLRFIQKSKYEHGLQVELIDGVPGCGKSTWILDNADLYKQVVLATARESTDDLRSRFVKSVEEGGKAYPSNIANTQVRTVDSYFLNPEKTRRVDSFHFDEALMSHYGMICFCAAMLRAKKVICQGDTKQIPFINRVDQLVLTHSAFPKDRLKIVEKRISYRIPADVCYFLNKKRFYSGEEIKTNNQVVRSVAAKILPSISNLPLKTGLQYLTFTQADKFTVQDALYKANVKAKVNTVHEAQGQTFKDVAWVRGMKTENNIYPGGKDHQSYLIVGATRHTRSLVYYTVVEDALYQDIGEIADVMENQLRKCLVHESTK
uniref:Methyltransferase n=1 Tax=Erysiphe necator associated gora-like virus 1 TaxID=2744812 RepID=A0A8E3Z1F6_9VIRU|nr:methyltransferase [Erysiphe necator associated gora-like virus 1]